MAIAPAMGGGVTVFADVGSGSTLIGPAEGVMAATDAAMGPIEEGVAGLAGGMVPIAAPIGGEVGGIERAGLHLNFGAE